LSRGTRFNPQKTPQKGALIEKNTKCKMLTAEIKSGIRELFPMPFDVPLIGFMPVCCDPYPPG